MMANNDCIWRFERLVRRYSRPFSDGRCDICAEFLGVCGLLAGNVSHLRVFHLGTNSREHSNSPCAADVQQPSAASQHPCTDLFNLFASSFCLPCHGNSIRAFSKTSVMVSNSQLCISPNKISRPHYHPRLSHPHSCSPAHVTSLLAALAPDPVHPPVHLSI